MTNQELKMMMVNKTEVEYNNIKYTISAIIYRPHGSSIRIQIELKDKNENSVILVNPDKIQKVGKVKEERQ